MVEIFRNLFVIICLFLLGWGVIRTERVYQYPFFIGSMFASFLIPQAFAIVSNPGVVSKEALERVLFYSCLCAVACFVGYRAKPNMRYLAELNIPIDEHKLFNAGLALTAVGYFFGFLLSRTVVQVAANGSWTGPGTIYVFFAQVVNIAIGIFILQTLKRPNIVNITCTIIAILPLIDSVLKGRRQPTMNLAIIIGISFWFIHRIKAPRWLIVVGIILLTVLIPLFGALRGDFWNLAFSGNWQEVITTSQEAFDFLLKGDLLEFRNAALLMDIADKKSLYGFGTQYWDNIVFQYVPGQIVGFDIKKSFQFNLFDEYIQLLKSLYGYSIPNGYTITGIGDSFMEFGYFGCCIFGLIGYLFKHLWISALYNESIFSRLLYIGLLSPAMLALTHGIGRFIQETIFQTFFITLAVCYSRSKSQYKYKYSDF
jgi:hypothetical protein